MGKTRPKVFGIMKKDEKSKLVIITCVKLSTKKSRNREETMIGFWSYSKNCMDLRTYASNTSLTSSRKLTGLSGIIWLKLFCNICQVWCLLIRHLDFILKRV